MTPQQGFGMLLLGFIAIIVAACIIYFVIKIVLENEKR
tara:strand:+ start:2785 stop:2898 length:114 start_codon:yes stop_codon:yes gene_type:complete